jgi:hypothetical protein
MRLPSKLILSPALLAAALSAAAAPALAAQTPAMIVAVHPATGAASSYFKVSPQPGRNTLAGTLEVRNLRNHRIVVSVDPVNSLTATTLGSAYGLPSAESSGQSAWLRVPRRRLALAPRGTAIIPVGVSTPPDVRPGDYLSGISVMALGRGQESHPSGNIAISSVQRYAVGLFVTVPGPRHPLIRITSARVTREPAGLTFYLHASNAGNAILQNVHGSLLITRGRRTVARTRIGPGTFVTGTSIDYPLLVPREQPREGAKYRVRAVMRYHGGVARFDNGSVTFGHKAAQEQQDFGGRPVTDGQTAKVPLWLVLAGGAGALVGLIGLVMFLRRRRTPGPRVARRALRRAVAEANATRTPLALVRIADSTGETTARKLAAAIRRRLRANDSLYRLGPAELLMIAPDTIADAARIVCSDLQPALSKAAGPERIDIRVVEAGRRTADDLLRRLSEPSGAPLDDLELSADSFVSPPR